MALHIVITEMVNHNINYTIKVSIKRPKILNSILFILGPYLQPLSGCKVALTSGEWEVLGRNLWVDNIRQLVYFLGLRESPLEKHLYVVSLNRPGEVRLLTKPGHSYNVDINKVSHGLKHFLEAWNN